MPIELYNVLQFEFYSYAWTCSSFAGVVIEFDSRFRDCRVVSGLRSSCMPGVVLRAASGSQINKVVPRSVIFQAFLAK